MKVLRGFKYRLCPTKNQKRFFERHFGCIRFVYNHFLNLRSKAYNEKKETLSGFDCKRKLVQLKKEAPWLGKVNSQSLQESVLSLEKSYRRFFKGVARFPQFKTKKRSQSFTVPQHFKIVENKLYLPKLKSGIKCVFHRQLGGAPKSLTISRTSSGKYFVSFICEIKAPPLAKNNQEIGIDLGLEYFAACSNGEAIEHPKNLIKAERKLKQKQRQLSRKRKGSHNREKARSRLAIQHEKVTNRRGDFLHKLSSKIVNENQVIHLETLNVKGMLRNHCLAKSIADSGWSEFTRQLTYKAEAGGRTVKQIYRFYPSSKSCHVCGYVLSELKLSTREWVCPKCGTVHDRDTNASKVILNVGRGTPELTPVERRAAVSSILSMKQVASLKQEARASQ